MGSSASNRKLVEVDISETSRPAEELKDTPTKATSPLDSPKMQTNVIEELQSSKELQNSKYTNSSLGKGALKTEQEITKGLSGNKNDQELSWPNNNRQSNNSEYAVDSAAEKKHRSHSKRRSRRAKGTKTPGDGESSRPEAGVKDVSETQTAPSVPEAPPAIKPGVTTANEKDTRNAPDTDAPEDAVLTLEPPNISEYLITKLNRCYQSLQNLRETFESQETDRTVIISRLYEYSKCYDSLSVGKPAVFRGLARGVTDVMADINLDDRIYDLAIEILPTTCQREQTLDRVDQIVPIVIFNALINFTDVSERICSRICEKSNLLEIMAESLLYHAIFMKKSTAEEGSFADNVLGVIYNCSCWYSNRQRLRDTGLMWILKRVIELDDLDMKLTATLALAGILDEEESKFFKSETKAMEEMSNLLGKALSTPLRRCEGWSTEELAAACSRLAGNDVNKSLLVNAGILNHLKEMCQTGNEQEKIEALGAIWALAFDEGNRDKMVDEGSVVELIIKLKDSESEKVRTEAGNILWTLREELSESSNKHFQVMANEVAPKISHSPDEVYTNTKHIMISYNWESKVTVFKVHEGLEKTGYRVWIDKNEMKGSIVDAIAAGVENADVLLMCISPKYKNSKYCRAEAEYAFENDIDIIPLLLESDYKADGWLGLIKGTKKHFNFGQENYFNTSFQTLVVELGNRGKLCQKLKQEPTIVPEVAPVLQTTPNAFAGDSLDSGHGSKVVPPEDHVEEWSCDRAQQWLKENQCCVSPLKNFSGSEIAFLKTLNAEAPESFYSYLKNELKVKDIKQLSKLTLALKRL